ncbi:MAG: DUF4411 family protein [Saprospiraceae bacterium]|nr:DUF4411 family protein [Saprospiraceae bacterium]
MAVYVVDSNFFIEAHRINYPLDIATGFWFKVQQLANAGKIISIDKVKAELYDKNDALEAWCKANLPHNFFKTTKDVMGEYGRITTWAMSRSSHYKPNALNEFLSADEADAFVIAYCLADSLNRIVVTQEISEPNRRNKIKIPDCCMALRVNYKNTIEMFRVLGETF